MMRRLCVKNVCVVVSGGAVQELGRLPASCWRVSDVSQCSVGGYFEIAKRGCLICYRERKKKIKPRETGCRTPGRGGSGRWWKEGISCWAGEWGPALCPRRVL